MNFAGKWTLHTLSPALELSKEGMNSLWHAAGSVSLTKRHAGADGGTGGPGEMNSFSFAVACVFIVLGFLMIAIGYTWKVFIILASIENPPVVYLPPGPNSPAEAGNHEPSAMLGIESYERRHITSSVRRTIRHLRAEGGFFSLWRGFAAHLFFTLVNVFIRGICENTLDHLPRVLTSCITSIVSTLVLARLSMVCTHIIISKPQDATWVTRLGSTPGPTARKTIPSFFIVTLLIQVFDEVHTVLATVPMTKATISIAIFVNIFLFYGLFLPASIVLARVQASHLPENAEPIVPFDRSFGKTDGGDLTFFEAWRTVGWQGWKRIAWMVLKLAPVCLLLPSAVVLGVLFVYS